MVREFQRVIGEEARAQLAASGHGTPDVVVACVGGGSNAIGALLRLPRHRRAARRRGGGRGGGHRRRGPRACSTGCARSCSRTTTARSSRPTRSPRASTTRGRPRARAPRGNGPCRVPDARATTRSSTRSAARADRGDHRGARVRARDRLGRSARPDDRSRAGHGARSASRVEGTRTWRTSPRCWPDDERPRSRPDARGGIAPQGASASSATSWAGAPGLARRRRGARRRRRRRGRDRAAVLRPDHRRAGHPGRRRRGPLREAPRVSTVVAELDGPSPRRAARRDDLLQRGPRARLRPHGGSARGRGRHRRDPRRPAARGARRVVVGGHAHGDRDGAARGARRRRPTRLRRAVREHGGLPLRHGPDGRRPARPTDARPEGRHARRPPRGRARRCRSCSASASSSPAHAAAACAVADGVIVGSAIVRRMLEGATPEELGGVRRDACARRSTGELERGARPRRPRGCRCAHRTRTSSRGPPGARAGVARRAPRRGRPPDRRRSCPPSGG